MEDSRNDESQIHTDYCANGELRKEPDPKGEGMGECARVQPHSGAAYLAGLLCGLNVHFINALGKKDSEAVFFFEPILALKSLPNR